MKHFLKRSFLFLLLLALLVPYTIPACAENESTGGVVRSCGVNLLNKNDGSIITVPTFSNEFLAEGFRIAFSETKPAGAKMNLVVLYKDQLLPFYINDQQTMQYQYFFTIADDFTANFNIRFPLEQLNDIVEPGNTIYFVVLCGIDQNAEDMYDFTGMTSNVIAAPLSGNQPLDPSFEFDWDFGHICHIILTKIDGQETNHSIFQETQNTNPVLFFENDLPFSDPYGKGVAVPIVNGSLLMEDGIPMVIHPEMNNGMETFSLQTALHKGANSIVIIYLPTEKRAVRDAATSERYTVYVK